MYNSGTVKQNFKLIIDGVAMGTFWFFLGSFLVCSLLDNDKKRKNTFIILKTLSIKLLICYKFLDPASQRVIELYIQ